MHVSKELIERYHSDLCSPEEKKAVEQWLFSDDLDEAFIIPDGEEKSKLCAEIWDEVATVLPKQTSKSNAFSFKSLWLQAAAAIFVVSVLGATLVGLKSLSRNPGTIVVSNSSETINKNLNASDYNISLGPMSNLEINDGTGILDFCGSVMINPKKDIILTIQGICAGKYEHTEKMTFKKGLTYIALNYSSPNKSDEIIILEEGSLMGLPPLVKRQLMHQFNI